MLAGAQDSAGVIDWNNVDFSKAVARPLQRQPLWSLRVCMSMALPLLLACGMFVFLYFNGSATLKSIQLDSALSYWMEREKVPFRAATPCRQPLFCPWLYLCVFSRWWLVGDASAALSMSSTQSSWLLRFP